VFPQTNGARLAPAQALFPLTAHAEHHHCRYQYERSERNRDIKTAHLKPPGAMDWRTV